MLPAWYGFGSAVADLCQQEDRLEALQYHAKYNAFFQTMLSNMEQVMAKTDLAIAESYASLSSTPERAAEVFNMIRAEYLRSRQALLNILQTDELLAATTVPLRVRLPCVFLSQCLKQLTSGIIKRVAPST